MLINSILFNLTWFGCVLLGNDFGYAVFFWLIIHLLYSHALKTELTLISFITLIGITIDTSLMHLGVFEFTGYKQVIPFWLVIIWLAFAMTINGYLRVLNHSKYLQCIIGALFPPLSYFAGSKLGAVNFGYSSQETFILLSLLWAGLLPLFFYINQLMKGEFAHETTKNIH